MDVFFATMAIFIPQPWLAALPAAAFFGLYAWTRRRFCLVMAAVWVLYGLYEAGMYLLILCSGECNIRIDLLVIYPVLAVLSVAALVHALLAARANRDRP